MKKEKAVEGQPKKKTFSAPELLNDHQCAPSNSFSPSGFLQQLTVVKD